MRCSRKIYISVYLVANLPELHKTFWLSATTPGWTSLHSKNSSTQPNLVRNGYRMLSVSIRKVCIGFMRMNSCNLGTTYHQPPLGGRVIIAYLEKPGILRSMIIIQNWGRLHKSETRKMATWGANTRYFSKEQAMTENTHSGTFSAPCMMEWSFSGT